MTDVSRMPLYRTIWRWHFYAGLFVIPFILILSLVCRQNIWRRSRR